MKHKIKIIGYGWYMIQTVEAENEREALEKMRKLIFASGYSKQEIQKIILER